MRIFTLLAVYLFSTTLYAKTDSRICEVNAVSAAEALFMQKLADSVAGSKYGITVTNHVAIPSNQLVDIDVEINSILKINELWSTKYYFTFSIPNCRIVEMGLLSHSQVIR